MIGLVVKRSIFHMKIFPPSEQVGSLRVDKVSPVRHLLIFSTSFFAVTETRPHKNRRRTP